MSGKTPTDKLAWARKIFERFIDDIHELDRILHLSMQGLSQVGNMPKLVEALYKLDQVKEQATEEGRMKLENAKAKAEFANAEIKGGFPVLHAHTTVSLWGSLDALIFDLAALWLLHEPSTLKNEKLGRLKIPLAEYEGLTREERMEFLVRELARSVNADFKLGVGKFEAILEAIGLSGAVEPEMRKSLLELSQVRNVLVHRAGIADSRFVKTCPWVPSKQGDKIKIDHKTYKRFSQAVHDYLLCIVNRVRLQSGYDEYRPTSKEADANGSA